MFRFTASALALLSLIAAQNTASSTDIAVVQANFNQADLVPDLLSKFNPQGVLGVSFSNEAITTGQNLTQSSVGSSPSLTVTPSSGASELSASNKYTVLMIDTDVPGTNANTTALTRHWLVNGAILSNASTPWSVTYDQATTVTDYAGPGPAQGSGPHRYTILVFLQPSSFSPPANLSTAGTPLGAMLLNDYVTQSGLGDLVVANYFQVENGVATVTYAATSAVNTATITAASTASGASGSASHSSSASASATSSASTSSVSKGAASTRQEMGWGVAVGAVGVAGAVFGAGLGF